MKLLDEANDESSARIEAEERLAALPDHAARFAELVASGTPPDEAAARAGMIESSPTMLAQRPDLLAAISALREVHLGTGRTEPSYVRRLAVGVAQTAQRDGDQRVVLQAVRFIAELDGHLARDPLQLTNQNVNVQINIGAAPPTAGEVVDALPSGLEGLLR